MIESEILSETLQQNRSKSSHWDAWVVEIQQECNLSCPMCIAGSGPGKGKEITSTELAERIRAAASRYTAPDVLLISGGEPTIHTELEEFVTLGKESGFTKVIIISNGVRIANDPEFTLRLKEIDPKISIFLQFDSLDPDVLTELRGSDLSSIRMKSIDALESAGINYTLICVIKRGLNDKKILDVINLAVQLPHAEGIQFQPIRSSGRHSNFDHNGNSMSKFCVEKLIEKEISKIPHLANRFHAFRDHVNNPRGLSVAGICEHDFQYPTSKLFPDWEYLPAASNARSSKRIYIQEYQDIHSFTFENDRLSNIGLLLTSGNISSLDRHYIGV